MLPRPTPRIFRRLAVASLTVTVTTTALAAPGRAGSATDDATSAASDVHINDASAIDLYSTQMWPAAFEDPRWSGDLATCTAGDVSERTHAAAQNAVNGARALVGIDPVAAAPTTDGLRDWALMMADRDDPRDPNSRCYTPEAATVPSTAYARRGSGGAACIYEMLTADPRDTGATMLVRRLRLLQLTGKSLTFAGTDTTCAIHLDYERPTKSTGDPTWTAWPSAGVFPHPLVAENEWNLFAPDVDFSQAHAQVVVTGGEHTGDDITDEANKVAISTGEWSGLAFTVAPPPGAGKDYDLPVRVTVDGLSRDGAALPPVTWSVTLSTPTTRVVSDPVITGSRQLGDRLHLDPGAWEPAPDTDVVFKVKWLRNGEPVEGRRGRAYTITEDDLGADLAAEVSYNTFGWRRGVVTVAAPDPLPSMTTPGQVKLRAAARVGKKLRARTSGWPEGTEFSYTWWRNGTAIGGKSATRTVKPGQVGDTFAVEVVASADGYQAVRTRSSEATIKPGKLQLWRGVRKPAITGPLRVGGILRLDPGSAFGKTRSVPATWWIGNKRIGTGTAIRLGNKAVGERVRATTTLRKRGYLPETLSKRTAPVRR